MPAAMPRNPTTPPDRSPVHGADADECEFDAFAPVQDPLDIEAAAWVARKRNGLNAQGEAELQAWLDADPRHAAAFEDMDAIFGEVKQLPDADVASLKTGLSDGERAASVHPAAPAPTQAPTVTPPPARRRAGPAHPGRRQWLRGLGRLFPQAAAAAIAFAVVGGGWMGWAHWRQLPVFEQTYLTLRGQQLVVDLPDAAATAQAGSALHLDTATRLHARLYRDRREVHLTDGQALFTVRADAQRPFHVYAGALRITVVGTRFSVRHTASGLGAGQTVVSVEEGRVRVARADRLDPGREAPAAQAALFGPTVELSAGQTVTADHNGRIGPVASVPASAIASWRDGRLSFDQTPLVQAIAEFERYGRTGLVVRDAAVAALPVGGSYSLKHFDRFAETLPQVLPVRLVRRGEVTEIVAR